ncbi:hypothetical protein [Microcystis sp.]|jgi:hypothetical protein|uniref:hypothetical protein n=1 Tax=Microcystis sp. TaxID=1127 RepID=UPI00391C7088
MTANFKEFRSWFTAYSGKRLSEIQTKLCLAWFIARDTVPHTTAHRYMEEASISKVIFSLATE